MKRRIFAAMLVICLLLTGCQGQTDETSEKGANSSSSEMASTTFSEEELDSFYTEYYYPVFLAAITSESWSDTSKWENTDGHWADRLINYYTAVKYYSIPGQPQERDTSKEDTEPAEIVEDFIMQHFNVSREFLRTSQQYDAEREVYILEYLGGAASSKVIGAEENSGVLALDFEYYSPMDDTTVIRTGTLSIQTNITPYKYLSCESVAVDSIE